MALRNLSSSIGWGFNCNMNDSVYSVSSNSVASFLDSTSCLISIQHGGIVSAGLMINFFARIISDLSAPLT